MSHNQEECRGEEGQAIVIVVLAMSIFLLGAVGLAIDGAHLYSQRQMAQTAADAAAQAGIMSIFDGTNGTGTASFSTGSAFTCSASDLRTPCVYASNNGFGGPASDTVVIDFPAGPAGVTLSTDPSYSAYVVRANVSRNVSTTLMRLLGSTTTTVKATATAAIVQVFSPVPILVLHPTLPSAFSLQGTPNITICGGPTKSIQVNSSNEASKYGAAQIGGSATVDLSHAGPKDTLGNCSLGTGADFGVFGYPAPPAPTSISLGSTGHYIQPASPIVDPLINVPAPPLPAVAGTQTPLSAGTGICPASAGVHGCTVMTPGKYPTGISLTNTTALMEPGIYYMQTGGFSCAANCNITTVTGLDGPSGTNTGWNGTVSGGGIMVYNSGSGPINIGANGSSYLIGSPATSIYKNILFFEDRSAPANVSPPIKNANSLGGGGAMTLIGTLYFTNTKATMLATPSHYQELDISGNAGSGTLIQGEIIADVLSLGGTGGIQMDLNPFASLIISQVALVN